MGEMATLIGATPGSRKVTDATTVPLLRRVVESLATMHPGRYTVYLGRPDPVAVRTDWEQEATLIESARRAVVATPATTPLPQEADRRDPGLGWLADNLVQCRGWGRYGDGADLPAGYRASDRGLAPDRTSGGSAIDRGRRG